MLKMTHGGGSDVESHERVMCAAPSISARTRVFDV